MSNTRVLSLVAAGAMMIFSGAGNATPVTGMVSPGPSVGPACTTYIVGGKQFVFDLNPMNNQADRKKALDNAMLGHYQVTVKQASDLGWSADLDTVLCNPPGSQPGQDPSSSHPTIIRVDPVTTPGAQPTP